MTTKAKNNPANFLWGAATSSHQIDGNNFHSDWWKWENEGGEITAESPSGIATDHWNRFREDLHLAKELGLTSYRFSIEWARVEPREGAWNKEAFDWYRELISLCEKLNILPMATLHHFTVPQWVADKGGFTSTYTVDRFAGYVRRVAREFGSRIPLWCTINEPMTLVVGQYLGGFMPPAVMKPKLMAAALRNMLLCHVNAYHILHTEIKNREGVFKEHPLMVGFAHNMIDFQPLRRWHPVDQILSRMARRFYNGSWPDAVTGRKQHFGVTGMLPRPKQVWEARKKNTVDFIGVNYYMKVYLCWGAPSEEAHYEKSSALPVGLVFAKKGEPTSDLGWAIYPEGLGRMLRFLKRYALPIYITENGIADARDEKRKTYLETHLHQLASAIDSGIDVRGYYHWSLLDNYEWKEGFGPRFGLIEMDYKDLSRKIRSSALDYRDIIRAHREKQNAPPNHQILNERK